MLRRSTSAAPTSFAIALACLAACASAPDAADEALAAVVHDAARTLMAAHDVPGLAIATSARGVRRTYCFGVASRATGRPVDERTLFEIGSVSKPFTATLAAYAAACGALSLSDPASTHWPELTGSSFDAIRVVDLGTYTAGGLPLQFPATVTDEPSLLAYYRQWRPAHAAGTHRVYSNASLGLFGRLAANSMDTPFADLMERSLLPPLGLRDTFYRVPAHRLGDYADGHAANGARVRMAPGPMAAESYGAVTTAGDLLRFVEANLETSRLEPLLQQAIAATHVGHCRIGTMVQCLGWEMYADAADLDAVLAGKSPRITFEPNAVEPFATPQPAPARALFDKTGATNGFSAYVAFVPAARTGVIVLANRNVPADARVRTAHRVLEALAAGPAAPTGR
jgi:beta-lactamase class C